jgi:membrane fusion protein (multidrug efflux system)
MREWGWRSLVLLFALGALILITTRWSQWESNARTQTTDDAYLQADLTPIAAKVAGYVRAMPVEDYQRVQEGDLLAEIVDDDYCAAVDQLQAGVAAASAQIEALKAQRMLQRANLDAARAQVAAATANIEQNARDIKRQQKLFQTGSSSTEAAEKLQTTHAQLAAQLDQNRAQAAAADRQLSVLAAQQAQAAAALAAQQASLRIATINLGYTRIVAPKDGVIAQRQVKPGQFVGVGGQITTLTPLPQIWVIANFKETQHVDGLR